MNLSVKLSLTCFLLFLLFTQCLAADPKVQTWIDRANTASDEVTDPAAQNIVSDPLARALARSGDSKAALAAAKKIVEPLTKMYVLAAVAKSAQKTGDKVTCREAVESASQDAIDYAGPFYTQAYIELCFAAGMPDAAKEYADKLFEANSDPQPYLYLVQSYAASGDSATAEKLLQQKQLGDQGKLYAVRGSAEVKNFDAASKLAGTIDDSQIANQAHDSLAVALAHAGMENAAMLKAALISDAIHRNRAQGEVAVINSQGISLDQVRKGFAASNSRDHKIGLLGPLVGMLLKISAFGEAEQAIEEAVAAVIAEPRPVSTSAFGIYGDDAEIAYLRSCHLMIADKLIKRNQVDKAAEQVAKIEPLYDALSDEAAMIKWTIAPQLIDILVQLGELNRAEAKLQEIEDLSNRYTAAVPLAVHYVKAGDVEKGLEIVTANDPEGERYFGNENDAIAIALLESVSVARAAEFLESFSQTEGHAEAITNTARELVESKRLDKLEKLYSAAKSPFVRTLLATEAVNRLLLTEK
jgi:hypothetical protein